MLQIENGETIRFECKDCDRELEITLKLRFTTKPKMAGGSYGSGGLAMIVCCPICQSSNISNIVEV